MITVSVEVPKDAKDKRQALCDELAAALMLNSVRVTAGTYTVVITKEKP